MQENDLFDEEREQLSLSQFQATMGITKDSMSEVHGETVNTMDALNTIAQKMSSETEFSVIECGEALNYLALAGLNTEQMCDTLPNVLNFAAIYGIDLAKASAFVIDYHIVISAKDREEDAPIWMGDDYGLRGWMSSLPDHEVLYEQPVKELPTVKKTVSIQIIRYNYVIACGTLFPDGSFSVFRGFSKRKCPDYLYKSSEFVSIERTSTFLENLFNQKSLVCESLMELKEILEFDKLEKSVHGMSQKPAELPVEILCEYSDNDMCGSCGNNIFWWWEHKEKIFHILGSETWEMDEGVSDWIGSVIFPALYEDRKERPINKIVVHEGITEFKFPEFLGEIREPDNAISEIILPDSLKTLPTFNCWTNRLVVPFGISSICFFDLMASCGGHFDPVEYYIKHLIVPSTIQLLDDLLYNEPIENMNTIEVYGETPIQDIKMWVDTNMFIHNSELVFLYPREWDVNRNKTVKEEIMEEFRKTNPEFVEFGMFPTDTTAWIEDDYAKTADMIQYS